MEKTIELNGKELKFKSSAATNILYKRTFKEDILVKLTSYTKNLKELKAMQAKANALQTDTRPKEEIAEDLNNIIKSDVLEAVSTFSSETLPKLAYVMYVEANESAATIFSKLNEEAYLVWLMGIDQDELLSVTGQVMDIWTAGARNQSKPKN